MQPGYAGFYSRAHDAVIRVYDKVCNVIETYEHAGEFKELSGKMSPFRPILLPKCRMIRHNFC